MPQVALEFRHEPGNLAANGTDVIMWLDGRWNAASRVTAIWAKLDELRSGPSRGSAYRKQQFVGFTYMGRSDYLKPTPHVKMSDPNPPAWVHEKAEA